METMQALLLTTIAALAGDQIAQKSRSGGAALLLVGGRFTANFEVLVPAKQPAPAPVPEGRPRTGM